MVLSHLILVVFTILHFDVQLSAALGSGTCYQTRNADGLCFHRSVEYVTRAECCELGGFYADYVLSGPRRSELGILAGVPRCSPACTDGCRGVRCPLYEQCSDDAEVGPHCVCDPQCSEEDMRQRQVCSQDGNVYDSYCALKQSVCYSKSRLRYVRSCSGSRYSRQEAIDCSQKVCNGFGQKCVMNEMGKPVCMRQLTGPCNSEITQSASCSIYNTTYNNICERNSDSLEQQRVVAIAYNGVCRAEAQCSNTCSRYQTCLRSETGTPVCQYCPSTCVTTEVYQVCGSDGITYASYCALLLQSCSSNTYIGVERRGPC